MAFNWFKKKKEKTELSEGPAASEKQATQAPSMDDIADEAILEAEPSPEAPRGHVTVTPAQAELEDETPVLKEGISPAPVDDAPAEKKKQGSVHPSEIRPCQNS